MNLTHRKNHRQEKNLKILKSTIQTKIKIGKYQRKLQQHVIQHHQPKRKTDKTNSTDKLAINDKRQLHKKPSLNKQEMSLKKTNGVGLKKEENITQARLSTCS